MSFKKPNILNYFLVFVIYFSISLKGINSHFGNKVGGNYISDVYGVGEEFDGIGAISGGGATSKLLRNYPIKKRNEILDYLFKPNFAASLQILKVEIGGDSQSTDGSESSHMHEANEANYQRGYEWWLMKEAKNRNPRIKLYGLPWTFPGWLGDRDKHHPFSNLSAIVLYTINWIRGAKEHHNLTIDFIGIWNERECNYDYIKLLRSELNRQNFSHVKIVMPDSADWSFAKDIFKDKKLLNSIDIIGLHYPGASSPTILRNSGKKIWASEDFSDTSELEGGACWARIMNEGPVSGFLTSFIAWNLITSYYDGLPYSNSSLMTANEPWSGYYSVDSPIWITAHHTQFYKPGWSYLLHGQGVGKLEGNGTYVSLTNDDHSHLTIVIETIDPRDAGCFYPMPKFTVDESQIATFKLYGSFSTIEFLNVRHSNFNFKNGSAVLFESLSPIAVQNGQFSIELRRNHLYTLSTYNKGFKGHYQSSSVSKPFPVPYFEDFESYKIGDEPFNFAQQSGSYEVTKSKDSNHNLMMTQVVTKSPIDTCQTKMPRPANIIGSYYWKNVEVQTDVYYYTPQPTKMNSPAGVFLASQLSDGGCDTVIATGFHFWLDLSNRTATLTLDHAQKKLLNKTHFDMNLFEKWFTIALKVQNNYVTASVNGLILLESHSIELQRSHGFVALGPMDFSLVSFDNFRILQADVDERREIMVKENDQESIRGE